MQAEILIQDTKAISAVLLSIKYSIFLIARELDPVSLNVRIISA